MGTGTRDESITATTNEAQTPSLASAGRTKYFQSETIRATSVFTQSSFSVYIRIRIVRGVLSASRRAFRAWIEITGVRDFCGRNRLPAAAAGRPSRLEIRLNGQIPFTIVRSTAGPKRSFPAGWEGDALCGPAECP